MSNWDFAYRGGGVRGGKFSPWDISQRVYFAFSPEFAVGNFAPTCCEPTFGWWWLLLFADALLLSPRGLLFLPDELLVAGCCYFMVVVVISWWLLVFSDALLLPFNPCKAQYSALRPLNKGCSKQLKNCFRWLQLTSQDPPLQILIATFLCFSCCGRAQQTYAQATVGQNILLNFAAGLFRTAA